MIKNKYLFAPNHCERMLSTVLILAISALCFSCGLQGSIKSTETTTSAVSATSDQSFVNGGNSFASDSSLGNLDSFKLNFLTNGLPRLTITSVGNVGIGTTTPGVPLYISTSLDGGSNVVVAENSFASAGSIDETTEFAHYLGAGLYAGGIRMGKEADYTSAANRSSYMGIWTRNAGSSSEKIRVTAAGNVGISTTSPQTKLAVNGIISPSTDNTYSLGNSSYRFTDIYATGTIISTSDERSKINIRDSDLGLDFINNLRPVSYYWKEGDPKLHYGVIAQETEKAIDRAKKNSGRENEVDNVIVYHDEKTDRYGVRYTELIAPLIKAIQELYGHFMGHDRHLADLDRKIASMNILNAEKEEVETLKIKNAKLEQENAEIKVRLDKIEKILKLAPSLSNKQRK